MSSNFIYIDKIDQSTIHYIYVISNTKTDRLYIGVTSRPEERMREHMNPRCKKNSASKIKSAARKYGPENFTMTLIYCTKDKDDAYEKEKFLIVEHKTLTPNGYNIHPGGYGGSTKGTMSAEGRKRISESAKGKPVSDEFRQNVSDRVKGEGNPMYGRHHTEEAKQRMSEMFKGKQNPFTQEHKDNLAKANRERIYSEEEVERCRQLGYSNRGRKMPPRSAEYRKNMSEKYKGKPRPTTTCPHCDKVGGVGGMQKWHFDNCKQNPANTLNQSPTLMFDED